MKKSLILAIILTTTFFSCDWRVFEDLKNSATVQVIESPDEFSGANFGQVISVLKNSSGETVPDKLIIGGASPNPLIIVDFTDSVIKRHPVTLNENVSLEITAIVPITSEGSDYRIVVSSQEKIHFMKIHFDEELGYTAEISKTLNDQVTEPGLGRSFDVIENNETIMVVASSDIGYMLYPDIDINEVGDGTSVLIKTPVNFTLPVEGDSFVRFIRAEQEVFLALGGHDTQDNIWSLNLASTNADLTSSQISWLTLKGNSSYPGQEVINIQAGDMNSDGKTDILAAVSGKIYIFYSGIESGDYPALPSSELYVDGLDTGYRMIVTDLNDDGVNEVVSSNPQSGDTSSVYIHVSPVVTSPLSPAVTIDTPENEKYFGSSFAAVPSGLNPTRNELFIGGMNSIYLFYITGLEGDRLPQDDPRN